VRDLTPYIVNDFTGSRSASFSAIIALIYGQRLHFGTEERLGLEIELPSPKMVGRDSLLQFDKLCCQIEVG
jgi:hypothetical protein